jgi:hypothetical protein
MKALCSCVVEKNEHLRVLIIPTKYYIKQKQNQAKNPTTCYYVIEQIEY